jgi:hypothetical protein
MVADAQEILDAWREDCNLVRPRSSLQDRTPAAVGAMWVESGEARESTPANEERIELEATGHFVSISPSQFCSPTNAARAASFTGIVCGSPFARAIVSSAGYCLRLFGSRSRLIVLKSVASSVSLRRAL